MVRPVPRDERAIVRPAQAFEHFRYDNWAPDPPLHRFVNRFWRTAWDLPEPFVQTIVTHPAANLVVQADGTATVTGVQRANDDRRLVGAGWALGVLFRPGGFRPFAGGSMRALTDRRVPASELWGDAADALAAAVVAAGDDEARVELMSTFLCDRAPDRPTVGEDVSALVDAAIGAVPPVTRVEELAARAGVSVRTVQRLFDEHVGIGPKWVLDRSRVHTVAGLAARAGTSWSDAAHDLGFADQAHLTAAFRASFGAPPASYARAERRARRGISR
jgi:AraC-like DNA-binding protein